MIPGWATVEFPESAEPLNTPLAEGWEVFAFKRIVLPVVTPWPDQRLVLVEFGDARAETVVGVVDGEADSALRLTLTSVFCVPLVDAFLYPPGSTIVQEEVDPVGTQNTCPTGDTQFEEIEPTPIGAWSVDDY